MTITKKATITPEMLIKTITNYSHWLSEIKNYYKSENGNISPTTARYGIEASMPRGSGGGHSNPTFVQAVVKRGDTYIERRIRAIKEIDRRKSYVYGVFENDVLDLWLQGFNNMQIAKEMGMSERTIRRYKKHIIDRMANII